MIAKRPRCILLVVILIAVPVVILPELVISILEVAAESEAAPANTQQEGTDNTRALSSKDLMTLLSTLIGGLLAVIGGFVSNHLLQSRARQAEIRKATREKLEELYVLTIQVDDWLQNLYRVCITGTQVASDADIENIKENPIAKLLMLVKLYEPSLSQDAEQLSEQLEHFRLSCKKYLAELPTASILDKGEKPTREVFISLVQLPFDVAVKSQQNFMKSIERVFQI